MTLRLPIQRNLPNVVLSTTQKFFVGKGQLYLEKLYCAMFVSAYYGLLRIGEIALGPHIIQVTDVHVGVNKKKVLFVLRSSKTHVLRSKPQVVKIISNKHKYATADQQQSHQQLTAGAKFCSFELLQCYVHCRKNYRSLQEPFFVYSNRSPVLPYKLCEILKQMLALAGFDDKLYNGHSLRVGRARDMFDHGIPIDTIKDLGRWKSNSVFAYLK